MKKSNKVICLGAGEKQLPLIKASIELGLDVVLVDRDPKPLYKKQKLEIIRCSTHDSKRVISELRRFFKDSLPKAVIHYTSGKALITVALICKEFKLSDISLDLAKASVEKTFLYEFCKKLNIPIPYSTRVKSLEDIKDNYIGMVIKPDLPKGGTRNVYRLLDTKQSEIDFKKSREESINDFVKVQKFVFGLDLIVIAIVQKKEIVCTMFLDQWVVLIGSKFKKIGSSISSIKFASIVIDKIYSIVDKFIKTCKINFGFISFSFRVDSNNDIWLYEVNPGLLGDGITEKLLPKAFPDTFKNIFKFNLELIDGSPLKSSLKDPLPFSIFEGQLMPRHEAIKMIFLRNDLKDLQKRITQFNKLDN